MFEVITKIYGEALATIVRAITGSLYTEEQIKSITSSAVGKYLKEFFPAPKEELEASYRVDSARKHIEFAATIIRDMQNDLEAQDQKLNELMAVVDEKKKLADRYQTLADTNKKAFDAFREEMEDALRNELKDQELKGKRVRQMVSAFLWIFTLIAGAALGSYFQDIVWWFRSGT